MLSTSPNTSANWQYRRQIFHTKTRGWQSVSQDHQWRRLRKAKVQEVRLDEKSKELVVSRPLRLRKSRPSGDLILNSNRTSDALLPGKFLPSSAPPEKWHQSSPISICWVIFAWIQAMHKQTTRYGQLASFMAINVINHLPHIELLYILIWGGFKVHSKSSQFFSNYSKSFRAKL